MGGPQVVRYFRHESNKRLPATRNTGIAAARAAWVALLDSDDLWAPEHLAVCMERADRGDVDLVHGGAMLFDSDSGADLELRAPDAAMLADFPRSLFENRYVIQPSTALLSRALWERVGGFNPDFHHLEDREMWLRCVRAGGRFAFTGKTTCRYRKHRMSMSTPTEAVAEMAENSARLFEQHLDWETIPLPQRRRLTAEAWAAAARLRWRSEPRVAREHFRRACAIEWRPRWWLHGALCALRGK
jgi:GT2 family glycosyltransferase